MISSYTTDKQTLSAFLVPRITGNLFVRKMGERRARGVRDERKA